MIQLFDVKGDDVICSVMVVGEEAILFDPGTAHQARQMVRNIKNILGRKPLRAVFLTHSHYDHVAALPIIQKEWPEVTVYGAAYAADVFKKEKALDLMDELSREAAEVNGAEWSSGYFDAGMSVDEVVGDGMSVTIGDLKVDVHETIGHTRCSLSFCVSEVGPAGTKPAERPGFPPPAVTAESVLICSETVGVICGDVYSPCYLISYEGALAAIEKCRRIPAKRIFMSHSGEVNPQEYPDLWGYLMEQTMKSRDDLLALMKAGKTEAEVLEWMSQHYRNEESKKLQPDGSFFLNARSILKTLRREYS